MEQRQFKFRIWDIFDKSWQEGPNEYSQFDKIFNLNEEMPEDWIIQQFTGLTDKNGKDIYEGDVVYFRDFCNYLIYWDEDLEGFNFRQVEFQELYNIDIGDGWPKAENMEIIGNITEHPELLK